MDDSAKRAARIRALFDEPERAVSRAVRAGVDVSVTLRLMQLSPEERRERANRAIADLQKRKCVKPEPIGPV